MRVLLVHNFYQQPGGEDECFTADGHLLERFGHEVIRYTAHNDAIDSMGRAEVARKTLWNRETHRDIAELVKRTRPDIAHFENTFPLISPSAYYAARAGGAAVVQTLHNYRLYCPGALFFRDGKVCEDCIGKAIPTPAIRHRCYRGSRSASAGVAGMLTLHRMLGTWKRKVDRYIALTNFARDKFIQAGLPADQVAVSANFLKSTPEPGDGRNGDAVFVGRLTEDKGVPMLLDAWQHLGKRIGLKIIGDGPLADYVRDRADGMEGVTWLGRRDPDEVLDHVGQAAALIVPSIWYETFNRTIIEGFAKGTPVIAANHGAMGDLIQHRKTGLHFAPGDPASLIEQVDWLLAHANDHAAMRMAARADFLDRFTAEATHERLMSVYETARQRLQ